jgi:hypothetical protein
MCTTLYFTHYLPKHKSLTSNLVDLECPLWRGDAILKPNLHRFNSMDSYASNSLKLSYVVAPEKHLDGTNRDFFRGVFL